MRYVQYYFLQGDKLVEACGDRAVVILDGRNSLETSINDAIRFNGLHRPIYHGFQIRQGDSFTKSMAMTKIITKGCF